MARPPLSGSKVIVILLALSLVGTGLIAWAMVAGPLRFYPEAHALFDASVTRAARHPAILQTLGEPVERGVFPNFEISGSGLTGTGHFVASLSGPNAEAELRVVLSKRGGVWAHELTEVSIAGQRVPLLSVVGEEGATTTLHRDGVTVVTVPGTGRTWSWSEGTENWMLASNGTLMMADRANSARTLTVLGEQLHRGAGIGEEEAREKVLRARARLAALEALGQSVP